MDEIGLKRFMHKFQATLKKNAMIDLDSPHYDYYYQQRLKYKDDERLHKYIELSKIVGSNRITDKPCYNPETMLFTIYIYTNVSLMDRQDFNPFQFTFFPDLGNSWPYEPIHFFNCIFEGCVREGLKQKSERVFSLINDL